MKNILLLGKNGQLGWELQRTVATLGRIQAVDFPEINLANLGGLDRLILDANPDIVINATAYTAVDRAEQEQDIAMLVNAQAPGVLADLAKRCGAIFVHYSTDYVFDGTKGTAYVESDAPNPLNVYGASKLAGEQAIQVAGGAWLVLRTSWVYSLRRPSFVTKVLEWARQQETLRVVSDQVGNPTWARMLAEVTAQMLAISGPDPFGWVRERSGVYHLAGSGSASRLEWADAILRLDPAREQQHVRSIEAAATVDFPTPAVRPLFSALDCTLFKDTFGLQLPSWQTALQLALQD